MFQILCDSNHRLRSYCWETARRSIRPNFSVRPLGKTVLDQKMNDNFFVGLDELYHHAKFVEDRTSCAGYNWENMVCFLLAGFAKRQDAGIRFLHRPKINFFAHRGVQRFTSNLAWPTPTGTWVRLAEQNLSSIVIWEWECGHKNIKSYHFLVLPSPISIIFIRIVYGWLCFNSVSNFMWFASQVTELLLKNRASVN